MLAVFSVIASGAFDWVCGDFSADN